MMRGRWGLYFLALSIPFLLGTVAHQAVRYTDLEEETRGLETAQEEWVENNKRLIAGIALLSSSDRIEYIAQDELGYVKKTPEEVLQIRIEGERRLDG
jgi:cell division protein FtsB